MRRLIRLIVLLGMIRRNFEFLDVDIFIPLYKTLVRTHFDFAHSVWYPYKKKHVAAIENVQRRITKQLPGFIYRYTDHIQNDLGN